jgi:hypothetical protein
MHGGSLGDDISEISVYKDSENELIPPDSNTKSDNDETHDHIAVIPPASSPLYCPLPSHFTVNVGTNVVIQSCVLVLCHLLTYFVSQSFINILVIRLTSTQLTPCPFTEYSLH